MRSFLAAVGNKVVIDAGILFEILTGTKQARIFNEMLFGSPDIAEHRIRAIGYTEIYYLLCRGLDNAEFSESVQKFQDLVQISSISDPKDRAGEIKCRYSISPADCFTIALAEKIKGKMLFKHEDEVNHVLINVNEGIFSYIAFIDGFSYFKRQIENRS